VALSIPPILRRRFWVAAGLGVAGLVTTFVAAHLVRVHQPDGLPLQIVGTVALFVGAALMMSVAASIRRGPPRP
jgi:hypothetical protein